MRAAISLARPWIPIGPESTFGTDDWLAEVAWSYPGIVVAGHACALRAFVSWARPWMFVSPEAAQGSVAWKAHLAWSIGCEEELVTLLGQPGVMCYVIPRCYEATVIPHSYSDKVIPKPVDRRPTGCR